MKQERRIGRTKLPDWMAAVLWRANSTFTAIRLIIWLTVTQLLAYGQLVPADANQRNTLIYLAVIFLFKAILLKRLEAYPGGRFPAYRLAVVAGLFAIGFFLILLFRLGYGRSGLFVGMILLMFTELVLSLVRRHLELASYVLIPPVQMPDDIPQGMEVNRPDSVGQVQEGVLVVDPDTRMEPDWLQFIVKASVSGRLVVGRRQLQERITGKVNTTDETLIEQEALAPLRGFQLGKRLLDIVVVLLLSPFVLLLSGAVAAVIRFESPGKVLFKQERIGKAGCVFQMYKFRSMRDAPDGKSRFANEESDRITRFGYFIRATHLDELPQLFNVLKGDMSLVGPRPEQPQFVEQFEKEIPLYRYRHLVPPGITGWAQVCQGYVADEEATREKLAYDLYYIKHLSLWLDILILARTLRSVLFDRHPSHD